MMVSYIFLGTVRGISRKKLTFNYRHCRSTVNICLNLVVKFHADRSLKATNSSKNQVKVQITVEDAILVNAYV